MSNREPAEVRDMNERPRLAVVIGIDHYTNGIPSLRNAARDARAVSKALRRHGFSPDKGNLIELIDQAANHETLTDLFSRRLADAVSDEHAVVVYFAGHGQAIADDEHVLRGFLLPIDARRDERARFLDMEVVREGFAKLRCRHLFVMLDCCSAGMFARSSTRDIDRERPPLMRARYDAWQRRRAYQLLASASYDEQALDSFEAKVTQDGLGDHSPFAHSVIEALSVPSAIDSDRDGVICATEIFLHTRRLLAETPASRNQTPNFWSLDWHDGGEFTFLFGDPKFYVPGSLAAEHSPYRGLAPFRTQDASLFFGRRRIATSLTDTVRRSALTILVGHSGTGKTSLLTAGVVPLLEDDCVVRGPARPGASPLAAFASTLGQLGDPSDDRPVVWIVDQLEELVTMTAAGPQRVAAFSVLRAAVGERVAPGVRDALGALDAVRFDTALDVIESLQARLRVVLSVRSDYIPLFNAQLVTPDRWMACQVTVPAMNREELRDCIERPAESRFLVFSPEPGLNGKRLVETLLDEVEQVPGGLPLLSVALDEMFRAYVDSRRDDCTIGWSEYRAIGGTGGALQRRAETVYSFAQGTAGTDDEAEREARRASLRDLMSRMVSFEGGSLARRRVARREFDFADALENARTMRVLEALIEARLVVAEDEHVEPAHDTLLRGWSRLLEWLDPQRIATRDRINAAAAEWQAAANPRASPVLWDDERLAELRIFDPLSTARSSTRALLVRIQPSTLNRVERAFIEASDRARRRRWWRVRAIAAGVMAGLAGAAVFSQLQRIETERQRSRSHGLLMQSYLEQGERALVEEHRPLAAMPYLIAAREGGLDTPALRRLFAWSRAALPIRAFDHGHEDHQIYVHWLDDRQLLLGARDVLQVWDTQSGSAVTERLAPTGGIEHVAVAGSAGRFAVLDQSGGAITVFSMRPEGVSSTSWNVDGGRPPTSTWPITGLAISADGQRLAIGGESVRVLDAASGKTLLQVPLGDPTSAINGELTHDGRWLLTSKWQTARIWDVDRRKPLGKTMRLAQVQERDASGENHNIIFSISGDGRWIAGTAIGIAQLFDARTGEAHGKALERGPLRYAQITPVAQFTADSGAVLTSDSVYGTARVWTSDGAPIGREFGDGELERVQLARRADRVLGRVSRGARLYDLATGRALTPTIEALTSFDESELSPEGTRIAIVTSKGIAWIWDLALWLPTLVDIARVLDFSAVSIDRIEFCDSKSLVTQTDDQVVRLWQRSAPSQRTLRATGRLVACDRARARLAVATKERVVVHGTDDRDLVTLASSAGVSIGAFSHDGNRFVGGRRDGGTVSIHLWDIRTGSLEPTFHPVSLEVDDLAWHGNEIRVCSNNAIRTFDDRGQERSSITLPRSEGGSCDLDETGNRATRSSLAPYRIEVWDLERVAPVVSTAGHAASLSPDGSLVVIGDGAAVQVWDVASGRPITTALPVRDEAYFFAISPTNDAVAVVDYRGFFVWQLPYDRRSLDEWRAEAAACNPYTLRDGMLERGVFDATACRRSRSGYR